MADTRRLLGRLFGRWGLSGSAARSQHLCERLSLRRPGHSGTGPGHRFRWHRREGLQNRGTKTYRPISHRQYYSLSPHLYLFESNIFNISLGLGLICCILRILFCICPSHCISSSKKTHKKSGNKIDADHTTSLLRKESKRVFIAREPSIQVSIY